MRNPWCAAAGVACAFVILASGTGAASAGEDEVPAIVGATSKLSAAATCRVSSSMSPNRASSTHEPTSAVPIDGIRTRAAGSRCSIG